MNKQEVEDLYLLGNQVFNEDSALFYNTSSAEISRRIIYPTPILVGNEFKYKTSRTQGEIWILANMLEKKLSEKNERIALFSSEIISQFYKTDKKRAIELVEAAIEFFHGNYKQDLVLSVKLYGDFEHNFSIHESIEDFFLTEQPNFI